MKRLLNTLYVTEEGAYLNKEDDNLLVRIGKERMIKLPIHLLEAVYVFGASGCSPALMGLCAESGVALVFLESSGKFLARIEGKKSGNILLRKTQYQVCSDQSKSIRLSCRFIAAKVRNSRIVLERFRRDYPDSTDASFDNAIMALKEREKSIAVASSLDELRGIEGDAAHVYFSFFGNMLRTDDATLTFSGRIKRPPTDPVNAALSLFYSLSTQDIVAACNAIGLDPQMGFMHQDRPGRASLALDLIEELRAYYVDRFVLSLFNRGQLSVSDFETQENGAVFLTKDSFRRILRLWQERKSQSITHPFLKEKMPIGLLPYIQCQLLARFLRGDISDYPAFIWR